jgi:RsiW-degrading membrane proteinase PrsW (M82 family)
MKILSLLILITGILVFISLDLAMRTSMFSNLFPALLFVGAFTIPISLVVFCYGHVRKCNLSPADLTIGFVFGGILGVTIASIIERETLDTLNFGAMVSIGFTEETSKLIFPVVMYWLWRNRHQADGLIIGVASGMGFAAFETLGFGQQAIIQTYGSISSVEQLLLLRGLLSPAGHAAWTGLICAVLWRERRAAGHAVINTKVIGAFLIAGALHASWDVVNIQKVPVIVSYGGSVLIAVFSLALFLLLYRDAYQHLRFGEVHGYDESHP